MPDAITLERSLRSYGVYRPLASLYFWSPIFFLYFSERFSLDAVLLLSSIYYVTVVALEIPSGYLSDRISRTATLRLSSLGFVTSFTLFLIGGSSFGFFVAAQIAQAFAYASLSGTDTSFHYDTLSALGRESEYAQRESRIARNSYLAASASAVAGGALGVFDLRLAYVLSLVFAAILFAASLRLREPPRAEDGYSQESLLGQVASCLRLLRNPMLGWIFAYVVLMLTLEHVPYEFTQPYLAAVLGEPVTETRFTPLATGAMAAVFALLGAFAATRALWLDRRLGTGATLLTMCAIEATLITAMAAVVHPAVLVLLLLRSSPAAVTNVLVNASVTPRIPQAQRATYLSLHSLAGRLGWGSVLYGLSLLTGPDGPNDVTTISRLLTWCAVLAIVGLAALAVTSGALRRSGGLSSPA